MMSKRIVMISLGILLLAGCSLREYREYYVRKIHRQDPEWNDRTVQKLASGSIEVGMTRKMVIASLGEPDSISIEGNEEIWGYGYWQGYYEPKRILVYFIHIKNGTVTKVTGDKSKLSYLHWRR